MRICLVHPYAWPEVRRGGERYVHDLTWYLQSRGHEVCLVTGTEGPSARRDGHTRLRHMRIPRQQRIGLSAVETFGLRSLPTLLRARKRYDVVHAFTPSAAIAARLAGHRTIYTVLGHPERAALPRRAAKRRLLESALRGADVVTALSPASALEISSNFGRNAEVLPPGIRVDDFPLSAASRTEPPLILFSAAVDRPEKGLLVLLKAFQRVREGHPDARLHLSGSGDHRWALRELGAAGDRLAPAIFPLGLGTPEELPQRYGRSHVTTLPAKHEAFGLVLVESLACGTPVIGTDSGGMPSIVDDDRVGRIVGPDDADALAGALDACIELSRSPQTPERCRRHAVRWDWATAVGPAHEHLYERTVAGHRSRIGHAREDKPRTIQADQ